MLHASNVINGPFKDNQSFPPSISKKGCSLFLVGEMEKERACHGVVKELGPHLPPLQQLLGMPVLASLQTTRPTGGICSMHYTECLVSEKRSSGQILCLDLSKVERIQKPLQQIIVFPTPTWGHGLSFLKFSQYFTFLWELGGGRGVEGLLSQFEEDSPFSTPGYCQHLHGGQLHSNQQSLPIYRASRPLDH